MRDRCDQLAHELEYTVLAARHRRGHRAAQFLRWLIDDHLIFLGYRDVRLRPRSGRLATLMTTVPGTGLGLLREGRPRARRRTS